MQDLVYLHSKTCIAELWQESNTDQVQIIISVCKEAVKKAREINLALPNRDGWIEAACTAKEMGFPINFIITNARARTFSNSYIDSFYISEARQENFIRNILREAEYLLTPETAGIYCALQSHRIARAESSSSVVFALQNPMDKSTELCRILDKSPNELPSLMLGRHKFLEK